jgi:hypothetical protein
VQFVTGKHRRDGLPCKDNNCKYMRKQDKKVPLKHRTLGLGRARLKLHYLDPTSGFEVSGMVSGSMGDSCKQACGLMLRSKRQTNGS